MQLDDIATPSSSNPLRVKEASELTVRWLDRCLAAHKKQETQALFGVVQGDLDLDLRGECCRQMMQRDVAGFAIGGLSGGEAKEEYCRVYGAPPAHLKSARQLNQILALMHVPIFCQS
jgi:tRNA-guanine family transglycosylase